MTVKDILKKWLTDNGYDGLVNPHGECGCEASDLVPCDSRCDTCQPAHRGPDLEYDSDWAMYATKEAAEEAKAAENREPAPPPDSLQPMAERIERGAYAYNESNRIDVECDLDWRFID